MRWKNTKSKPTFPERYVHIYWESDRQTERTVSWCLTWSDLEAGQLGENCQTLAGSCWLMWAVMEKKIRRELGGSVCVFVWEREEGRESERGSQQKYDKVWQKGEIQLERHLLHCRYSLLFLSLILQSCSSKIHANKTNWIEIELNRERGENRSEREN